MQCNCGFLPECPNCSETNKIVKAFKDNIIKEIEKIPLQSNGAQLNAIGMKILVIDIINKIKST